MSSSEPENSKFMDNFIHHALFKKMFWKTEWVTLEFFFRELGEEGSYGIEKQYPL